MGVFGVIGGQNPKIFKPRQVIYQNGALGALKRPFNQLPRAKREARKGDLSTNYLERSERLRRRDRFTKCLERSESLGRETRPPITSSEARG